MRDVVRVLLVLALSGCSSEKSPSPTPPQAVPKPPPVEQELWFEEVAASIGIDFLHVSGADPTTRLYLPEIVCGGVALLDYDGDGNLDVYLVQGGRVGVADDAQPPNRLYRNRGDGTFEDVTEAANAGAIGYGMGCAAGDVDSDGDLDIYITNAGRNALLLNDGDGTFTLAPDAWGAGDAGLNASAAFFDYDRDGDLDLVVTNYVIWTIESELSCHSPHVNWDYCHPKNYQAPSVDHLYRNDGGHFVDVTVELGIDKAVGNGLGVATGDFDGDGRLDFFIANDKTNNNHWYQTADGRFVERGLSGGTAVNLSGGVEAGMGVAAFDVDGDQDLDLFLSHLRMETNTLYVNEGTYFDDGTDRYGLGASSIPSTGFGLGFADFDLDGDLDLYIANGMVGQLEGTKDLPDPYAEPNLLYSQEDGKFVAVQPTGGTVPTISRTSRGAAFGDLDNDGDIDIVVANRDAAPSVLRNRASESAARHWIVFDVREKSGAPAQHAWVKIFAGGKAQTRFVDPYSSYCSSNDPRVHFGLGAAEQFENVVVRWFDGTTESFAGLAVDRFHRLTRGGGSGE